MRTLLDTGFGDDDGAADPALAAELASYDEDPDGRHACVLSVLQHTRLLVPVVAQLGEVEYDEHGRARDKTSEMAAVLMRSRSGRLGLLAFTSLASLAAWDPAARPVPVSVAAAAQAALAEGADALLVDVAGPVLLAVERDDLAHLAAGELLVAVGEGFGWIADPL